jgi:hypothetical protein
MTPSERRLMMRRLTTARDLSLGVIHHPSAGALSLLRDKCKPTGLFHCQYDYGLFKCLSGWFYHTAAYSTLTSIERRRLKEMELFWTSADIDVLDGDVLRNNVLEFLGIVGRRTQRFMRATRLADFLAHPFDETMTNLYLKAAGKIARHAEEFDDILFGNILFDFTTDAAKKPKTFSDLCAQIAADCVCDAGYFTGDAEPFEHEQFMMNCKWATSCGRFWESIE